MKKKCPSFKTIGQFMNYLCGSSTENEKEKTMRVIYSQNPYIHTYIICLCICQINSDQASSGLIHSSLIVSSKPILRNSQKLDHQNYKTNIKKF